MYNSAAGKGQCTYIRADVCRVNAVVPGGIETKACLDWTAGVGMSHDDLVKYQCNHITMQRSANHKGPVLGLGRVVPVGSRNLSQHCKSAAVNLQPLQQPFV